ncbi:MAG: NmrA family NAD(P)-binding protein [Gammaproteobacteria bacterium]
MTILVVGATGTLGFLAAEAARAAGHVVVAMVRDRRSTAALRLRAAGVRLCVADLKDASQLDVVVRGINAVIITATATLSRREGDSLEAVDGRGLQDLITACIQNGVRHVVFVSFSRGIDADTPLARFKRAAERRLESSALEHTILLPSYFPEKFLSPLVGFEVDAGRVRVYGDGAQPIRFVATSDVARVAALCAVESRGLGAVPMGGPEAYSQLEVVKLVERTTNRKLALEYMSLEQIERALKSTADPLKQAYLGLYRGLALGDTPSADWAGQFGLTPTRLETYVESMWGAESNVARPVTRMSGSLS